MNVGKDFLLSLGQVKLELLLVPALANPAHVFEWFASQWVILSDDGDLEAVDMVVIDRS